MPISLNSVLTFHSTLQAKYQHGASSSVGASGPNAVYFTSPYRIFRSRRLIKEKQWSMSFSANNRGQLAESSPSEDQFSTVKPPSLDSEAGKSESETQINNEAGPRTTEVPNGSTVSSNPKQETSSSSNSQPTPKRSPLTVRERLKAARVLNRYAEKKPKSEMGSNVLAALRESERGKKKSGLPEAPTNLLDDSKRGMPKPGLTFEFPGGADLFFIVLSFVLISTLMFTTTYVVWKVGAIHFNEF